MKKNTINDAIKEAFKLENKPLRVREVYWRIKEDQLYDFNTETPEHVVRTALRRHTENLEFASSSSKKLYVTLNDGSYWLKNKPLKVDGPLQIEEKDKHLKTSFDNLRALQKQHSVAFTSSLLKRLKELDPRVFEVFCRELLKVYGFRDVHVTKVGRDGGIDGHGQLKIGLSYLNVAFQCKRWNKLLVSRKEIDSFRGATQGIYQQAIFFTTSTFTKEAKAGNSRAGAIPIALFDGEGIIGIMIDKKFGLEVHEILTYADALDSVFDKEM